MIAIFREQIMPVGGMETWIYYLAKQYGKSHDITFYYGYADAEQLKRLKKLIRCVKYEGQPVECDTAIYCYDMMGEENTTAKKKIHIVHADYAEINLAPKLPDSIDEYYAVSKVAQRSFSKITGKKCGLLYNPVSIDEPHKTLRLISATRLTTEKGFNRMAQLAKDLDSSGIKYTWDVYTADRQVSPSPNMVFRNPELDISSHIKSSDYLVQLSDTESYCYSVVEALELGTPVIVTRLPVLKELKIDETHGIILELNESSYMGKIKDIATKVYDFVYKAPKSDYGKILGKGEGSMYKQEEYTVRNIKERTYFTLENVTAENGETFTVTDNERLKQLTDGGYVEIVENSI